MNKQTKHILKQAYELTNERMSKTGKQANKQTDIQENKPTANNHINK